jgi:hypothetical protein
LQKEERGTAGGASDAGDLRLLMLASFGYKIGGAEDLRRCARMR